MAKIKQTIMKNLKIEDSTALKLYKTATKELKEILEESFGKDFFNKKITDKVNNIDDIYNLLGIDREDVIPFSSPKNKSQKSVNALVDIQHITKCLNEDRDFPDFNNINQYKYYPYFQKSSLGWSFCGSFCHCDVSYLGFDCYFKTKELSDFAAKTFRKIYKDYLPE